MSTEARNLRTQPDRHPLTLQVHSHITWLMNRVHGVPIQFTSTYYAYPVGGVAQWKNLTGGLSLTCI